MQTEKDISENPLNLVGVHFVDEERLRILISGSLSLSERRESRKL